MGLTAKIAVTGGYEHTVTGLRAAGRFGVSPFPAGALTLNDGTGNEQANFVYRVDLSVAATTMVTYDLKGGGGELDTLNRAMAAVAVKAVYLEVTTPGASTSLRFGPQNQTDAAALWFTAVTEDHYATVRYRLLVDHPLAGWTIGATRKKVCVYNPGASTVAGVLLVFGTK